MLIPPKCSASPTTTLEEMNYKHISLFSGIYQIKNNITGDLYIGSSVNIKKRFNAHKCNLRNGIHRNTKLQRSFDKYGEGAFEFSIILICENEFLISNEARLVKEFNPSFNLRVVVENNRGIKLSDETKRKMSIARKGRFSEAQRKNLLKIQKRRMGVPVTGKVKESLKLGPLSCIGKSVSALTKEKIRLSKIGKKFNTKTRKYE